MRTQIVKAVRQTFIRKVAQELSDFVPIESQKIRAGDRVFWWAIRRDLNAYIYLFISPKYNQDKFAVELACGPGEFPLQMDRDPSFQKDGAVRFRLPQLYKQEWPKRNWEPMWEVGPHDTPEEAIERAMAHISAGEPPGREGDGLLPVQEALRFVEPEVQDAIDRIKRFGIPFFQRFADQKATDVPDPSAPLG